MNGFRMREIREAAGLYQIEVAAELGLRNETLCRWEAKGSKLSKLVEEAFLRLAQDPERVAWIRRGRRQRRRNNRKNEINAAE